MNKLEKKNYQNRVPLSPLESGLRVSVSHFFYLISQKISHFLNFGRKRTCAVMSRFVRNAISRLAVVLERPVFSQSLPLLMLLSLANICKISSCLSVKFTGPLIGSFIGSLLLILTLLFYRHKRKHKVILCKII